MTNSHPRDKEIAGHIHQTLTDAEREDLDRHLARCPQCRKKLELRGSGESQLFICNCGYREKLPSFEARKKKEGKNVSKKDVSKFLQEQKKESAGPINTALADALTKLKADEKK